MSSPRNCIAQLDVVPQEDLRRGLPDTGSDVADDRVGEKVRVLGDQMSLNIAVTYPVLL